MNHGGFILPKIFTCFHVTPVAMSYLVCYTYDLPKYETVHQGAYSLSLLLLRVPTISFIQSPTIVVVYNCFITRLVQHFDTSIHTIALQLHYRLMKYIIML